MRAVVQRVSQARVLVEGAVVGEIGVGLLVLLGIERDDSEQDSTYLADKTSGLRIFEDSDGKMNRSVEEICGAVLVVSQFTLLGDCRKGRRPGFSAAALPQQAIPLYEHYVSELRRRGLPVATGVFQASMQVELSNQGPVTMLLDSRKRF